MLQINDISLPFFTWSHILRFPIFPLPRRLFLAIFNFFFIFFPIPPTGFKEAMVWLPSAISTSEKFKSKHHILDFYCKVIRCQEITKKKVWIWDFSFSKIFLLCNKAFTTIWLVLRKITNDKHDRATPSSEHSSNQHKESWV